MGLGTILFAIAEAVSQSVASGTVGTVVARKLRGDLVEGDDDRPLMKAQTVLPKIYEVHIRPATSVKPEDYWYLSRYTCRLYGHSNLTWPYHTVEHRLNFSYRYYPYKKNERFNGPLPGRSYSVASLQVQGEKRHRYKVN